MIAAVAETPAELDEATIAVPTHPQREAPKAFPLVMVLAPVIVALVLYAVIHSPFVLLFAAFGPVMGVASVVDARIGARRRYRRAMVEYELQLGAARASIARAHARERRRARLRHPLAADIVAGAPVVGDGVTLGVTTSVGSLRTSGTNEELARAARHVDGMPFTVAAHTVVVLGPPGLLLGTARALLVSLLAADPAREVAVVGADLAPLRAELAAADVGLCEATGADILLASEPVPQHPGPLATVVLREDGTAAVNCGDGEHTRIVPSSLGAPQLRGWLTQVAAAQARRRQQAAALPTRVALRELNGDLVRASLGAARAAAVDAQGGAIRGEEAEYLGERAAAGAATFLADAKGPHPLDLVADGPHAVIGGTTGSGKSELLVAWALGLALTQPATRLQLLCLDFKGGATFDVLAELPHCSGIVTDLDGEEAVRVAQGLRAETHRRERVLREAGLREMPRAGYAALARLVVFIDEYQALVHAHPDLQEIVADVAARGRSLGIHLVLCTQRPTGTFRDELLANCAIRVCLRVELDSDSLLLLGSDAAASIPRQARGRAFVRVAGGEPVPVQVAMADAQLVAACAAREQRRLQHADESAPAPIWLPPLPAQLPFDEVLTSCAHIQGGDDHAVSGTSCAGQDAALPFGRIDLPAQQRQPIARVPLGTGLAVLGAGRSGKTTVLRTLAAAARAVRLPVTWVPRDVEGAWDTLALAQQRGGVVLVDDLDLLEGQFGDEHRAAFLERLQLLLRAGSATVILSARRGTGALQRALALCTQTLRLAHTNRNDWILHGGDTATWRAHLPPGRGVLGSDLVQVAVADDPADDPVDAGAPAPHAGRTAESGSRAVAAVPGAAGASGEPGEDSLIAHGFEPDAYSRWEPFDLRAGRYAVVARRTAPVAAVLATAGIDVSPPPSASALREGDVAAQVVLGDVEQWQAAYGALSRLSERRPVVVLGATVGQWRALFRADPLPPAFADLEIRGILRAPDGTARRLEVVAGIPVAAQVS